MKTKTISIAAVVAFLFTMTCGLARAAEPSDLFIVKTTSKSPAVVARAMERYAKRKKWQYLGAFKVKNGQVTLVKVCIPAVGKNVWHEGLYLSAMLPCGNIGIYKKDGKTEVSMLSARYMHVLVPTPGMQKAVDTAEPLLNGMLEAVLK